MSDQEAPDGQRAEDPEPAGEEPAVEDPSLASKWPWWVTAVVTGVALTALLVFLWRLWDFVATHDEVDEAADFSQLNAIVSQVETLSLLIIGAVLGVGAVKTTGAVSRAAQRNKDEAERQHRANRRNSETAGRNKEIADGRGERLVEAADLLRDVRRHAAARREDRSFFITATGGDLRHILESGGPVPPGRGAQAADLDPELATLAERADAVLAELEKPL